MSEAAKTQKINIISVVNNFDFYDKWIRNNPFSSKYTLIPLDNTVNNKPIPTRYNEFLDNYKYDDDSWLVFCHCDWELLEDLDTALAGLSPESLYGPVGTAVSYYGDKNWRKGVGYFYEEKRDGTKKRVVGEKVEKPTLADTFDCMCLIVPASLIKKHHLRFDEKLSWHLYVEDFCISAKLKYNIPSYVIDIKSCHYSSAGFGFIPKGYFESLKYINNKYPDNLFAGTISLIGGKFYGKTNVINQLRLRVMKKISN